MTSQNNPFVLYQKRIQGKSFPDEQPLDMVQKPEKVNPFFQLAAKNKNQEFPLENENDLDREIERSQAMLTSRIGESILGAPGDIASFVSNLFGSEQNILPTSKDLQEISEKATLGYTKPQNESEEFFSELASDVGSMMIPGGGHYSFARNIGVPVVGNLVKSGLKYADAGEEAEAYGKVGTMIALDLLSRKSGGVKKHMEQLFQKSQDSLPKGVSVNAKNLESSLEHLSKEMKKGGSKSSTTKALTKIEELREDIQKGKGKIDVSTLAAYRPSINEAIEELGGFGSEVPMKYRAKAVRNLNDVKDKVIKTLTEYGEKFNPEFLKNHQAANESWAAYASSNKIAKFLQDKVGYIPKSKAVQKLFDYGPVATVTGLGMIGPTTAIAGTLGAGGYQSFKILNRVMNSSTLRKYYSNVLKDALSGNVTATTKNLKALDILLKDQDQDDRVKQEQE